MRTFRAPVLIAWIFCLVITVLSVLSTYQTVIEKLSQGITFEVSFDLIEGLLTVLFAVPAALIISHQPRNSIGWLMMIPSLVSVLVVQIDRYLISLQSTPADALHLLLFFLSGSSWVTLIFPLLLIPLLFPTGKPPSRRWNWVIYLAIAMCLIFFFWAGFTEIYQLPINNQTLRNPIGFISMESANIFMPFWGVLLVTLTVSSLASMIARYRSASVIVREQMKWLLFGFAMFVAVYIPSIFINSSTEPGTDWDAMSGIMNMLFLLSILTIPAFVTMAVLRYKLFDIDVIIRLTLVYAVVTALLVAVYVGGIVALQASFRALTGQSSDVAVLVTTLVITVLFNPVRRRVQAIVDRRFYRQKYDAVQALAEFASAARGGSDLDALTVMLTETVSKTLQPTQVGLYMKGQSPHRSGQSDM